jgi:7,8-dihydropterin-6-yl-methyl-4-(beta-D-ribofuranosyl)aminobenzene 5'-phosphate synthase
MIRILFKKTIKMEKFSRLFILILATTIATVLEINIFTETGGANGGQVMNNESEGFSAATVKTLSIIITYDNNAYQEGFSSAWGFSCLIRGTEQTILFDTGGNGAILLANMKRLRIDPEEIDIVVLSHIHGDHVGGLERLIEENKSITIYLPRSFPKGFKESLKSSGIKIREVHDHTKICKGVYSTGELGTWIKEQSLIIHTERGMILITGCAHPGIVKIISKAKDFTGNDVLFVTGGFHLGGKGKRELEEILLRFRKLKVKYVGPCHCSGDLARQIFEKEYRDNYINVGVGRIIQFHLSC